MPEGFDRCRRQGGRIRTVKLSGNKYVHVCYLKGKSYKGYVKEKKDGNGRSDVGVEE